MSDQNSNQDASLPATTLQSRAHSNTSAQAHACWIVQEFLRLRSITFDASEFFSPEQHAKCDVMFRDLRFQVSAITESNSRRHAEIKQSFRSAMAVDAPDELPGSNTAYCSPAPVSSYQLVRDRARQLAQDQRYVSTKAKDDLLIHVVRTQTELVNMSEINLDELARTGWRSISVLIGRQALVLYGGPSAAMMLRHLPE